MGVPAGQDVVQALLIKTECTWVASVGRVEI